MLTNLLYENYCIKIILIQAHMMCNYCLIYTKRSLLFELENSVTTSSAVTEISSIEVVP